MKRTDQKNTVLVVDDEKPFCRAAATYLASDDLELITAQDAKSGLERCLEHKVDVVILDQMLPDGLGSDLCEPILKINEHTKIILVTAHPSFDNAVAGIKKGAFDYLTKPIDLREIEIVVERALRTTALEKTALVSRYRASKQAISAKLVGSSQNFGEIHRLIEQAAASNASVLVTGETGTGKNVVAKAIHFASSRSGGPFISLNCAALPDNLIETELFGHTKGAFTGANNERRGVFEMAEGGTLFLDEIGSMPISLQPKLLSVLDEGIVRRIGSDSSRRINVRIVAATNTALAKAITDKTFREDLYYRLNIIRIQLPPLRERLNDIPELSAHFVTELAPDRGLRLDEEEIHRLSNYPWPGNVREFRNLIERSIALQGGPLLRPSNFIVPQLSVPNTSTEQNSILTLDEMERLHITETLAQLNGNLSQTARLLDVSINTIKRKLKRYGLR